jgi:ACS family hexuronate transporter-like MFS transporter
MQPAAPASACAAPGPGKFARRRYALAAAAHSFDPIVIVAGLIPFVGMFLVLLLVRNTRATDQGLVRRI